MSWFLMFVVKALLFVVAIFMILLILIQRGKGGGLAGALGGMGGQSAFGTKAGDVFTRVTVVVAAIWILLCAAAVKMFKPDTIENRVAGVGAASNAPAPTSTQPAPVTTPAASTAPAASAPAAGPTGTGS
jgi:preprotein translocase subunit SecG